MFPYWTEMVLGLLSIYDLYENESVYAYVFVCIINYLKRDHWMDLYREKFLTTQPNQWMSVCKALSYFITMWTYSSTKINLSTIVIQISDWFIPNIIYKMTVFYARSFHIKQHSSQILG